MELTESDKKIGEVIGHPQASNGVPGNPRFWWLALLPLLTALHVFSAVVYPSDPDLGYHLAIGEEIISSGTIPQTDSFRSNSEAPEFAYSWLADITLAWSYGQFGVSGLRAWVMLSALVLSVVLVFLAGGMGKQLQICVALLAASIGLLQVCGPRPRLWAAICFALLLLRLQRPRRVPLWKESLVTAVIVSAWANIHVSVTLAPVIVAIVLGVMAAMIGGREAWVRCSVLTSVAGLAVLVNPYHYQLFFVGFDFSPWIQRSVSNSIVEMRGVFGLVRPYPIWIYPLGMLTAWALCQGTAQVVTRTESLEFRARSLGLLLVVLLCLFLTVSSSRHANFLLLSALATISVGGPKMIIARLAPVVGLATFLVVSMSSILASPPGNHWYDESFATATYPRVALESVLPLIQAHKADGAPWSIFAPFGKGHFITWWLRERGVSHLASVFVDGRTDRLGRERFLAATSVLRDPCENDVLGLDVDIVVVDELSELFDVLANSPYFVPLGGDQSVAFVKVMDIENRF